MLRTEKKTGLNHSSLGKSERDVFLSTYINECRVYKTVCDSFLGRNIRKEYDEKKPVIGVII